MMLNLPIRMQATNMSTKLRRAMGAGFCLMVIFGVYAFTFNLANWTIIKNRARQTYSTLTRHLEWTSTHRSSDTRQDLVWLLSYPFSGSTAMLRIVHTVSQKSCATNYGDMVWTNWQDFVVGKHDSIPVYENAPSGPFKMHLQLELPRNNILTKTMCSGYCIDYGTGDCTLHDYIMPLMKLSTFIETCSGGTKFTVEGKVRETVDYDPYRMKKGVVLIRDPIEIMVARFDDHGKIAPSLSKDRDGLLDFCNANDGQSSSQRLGSSWYTEEQKQYFGDIPCHAEFYKLFMWYNQAFKMLEEMERPEFVVHFDDLDDRADKTVTGLFYFLGLTKVPGYTIPFHRANEEFYDWTHWFTMNEMRAIKNFMHATASPRTKMEFDRYFSDV